MLGFNIFGAASGVIGLFAIAISLFTWLSPWRRLRALDATMDKAVRMLATMQEEYVILDHKIVRRAHEQLYRCVRSPRGIVNIVLTQRSRAREKAAHFRRRLRDVDSFSSTTLATFSPLPLEISKVCRQVQSVLDHLQASDSGSRLSEHFALTSHHCAAQARAVRAL
jgi:hypothetical protein